MLTTYVYRIQLKNQKKLHRRLGVFSGITKEKRLWTLPSVLGSLLKLLFIIRFIILNKKRNRSKETVSCKIPIHHSTLPLWLKMKHDMIKIKIITYTEDMEAHKSY